MTDTPESECDCLPWPDKCPYCGKGEIYQGPQEANGIYLSLSPREQKKRLMKIMSPPANPNVRS